MISDLFVLIFGGVPHRVPHCGSHPSERFSSSAPTCWHVPASNPQCYSYIEPVLDLLIPTEDVSLFVYILPPAISILLIPRLVKMMRKENCGFLLFHPRCCQHLPSHWYISEHTRFHLMRARHQFCCWQFGAYQTYIPLGIQAVQQPLSFHDEPKSFNWKGKSVVMKLCLRVI